MLQIKESKYFKKDSIFLVETDTIGDIRQDSIFDEFCNKCWQRFFNLDFGDICDKDKKLNMQYLEQSSVAYASYDLVTDSNKKTTIKIQASPSI